MWKMGKCWLPAFSPFPITFPKGIFFRVDKELIMIKVKELHLPLITGVFPTETSWSEKAVEEFKKFSDKVLFAKLIDVTSDDVYVLDLTDCDGVNVAQHLIDAGLAKKEEGTDLMK